MKLGHGKIALAAATLATVTLSAIFYVWLNTPVVLAYSIYPNDGSTTSSSNGANNNGNAGISVNSSNGAQGTTTFDFGQAWGQISVPFENFVANLQNIGPSALPGQVINPSTQIQSMMPKDANGKDVLTAALNFLSLVTGWLIGISDKIAAWIISVVK